MKLKKIYKYLGILIFFMITTNARSEVKIAYFDLNFIMAKSKAGISISKQLNNIKKKKY